MRLIDTLMAGGPGSGCHGPSCGRPKGSGDPHKIEPGDSAILAKPVKAWNMKTWNRMTYPIGQSVNVQSIIPAVGHNEAMAVVKVGKWGSEEHVKLSDLSLLKKGKDNLAKIDVKPVPKSKIQQQTKVVTGPKPSMKKPAPSYTITNLKPAKEPDIGSKKGPHPLKGQFQKVVENVKNAFDVNTRSTLMTAQPKTKSGKAEGYAFETNVWVHRHFDSKTVTIQEVRAGQHGYTAGTMRQYSYKSLGPAAKFVKERYGVSLKLPKW
jgi:hypothetical protein